MRCRLERKQQRRQQREAAAAADGREPEPPTPLPSAATVLAGAGQEVASGICDFHATLQPLRELVACTLEICLLGLLNS